jgi:hypothetical protein
MGDRQPQHQRSLNVGRRAQPRHQPRSSREISGQVKGTGPQARRRLALAAAWRPCAHRLDKSKCAPRHTRRRKASSSISTMSMRIAKARASPARGSTDRRKTCPMGEATLRATSKGIPGSSQRFPPSGDGRSAWRDATPVLVSFSVVVVERDMLIRRRRSLECRGLRASGFWTRL